MSETAKRPWWVPLLGVGSIGLGGFQCLGALGMAYMAAEIGGRPGSVFFALAAAWFVPGLLLAAAGVGVVAGTRWGRNLSIVGGFAMTTSLAMVAMNRQAIPDAVASVVEYGEKQGGAKEIVKRFRAQGGSDPVEALRDPEMARASAWVFTAECGCGFPWFLLVLAVCGSQAGRRIASDPERKPDAAA